MASGPSGTLYTGVTNDLARRVWEHRTGVAPSSFTRRYGVMRLVYFETFPTVVAAIHREKRLKKYHRAWKMNLIAKINPDWRDLIETWNA